MSSFTSVFKLREARVIICLLSLFAALELLFAASGAQLSHDISNIRGIRNMAIRMAAAPVPRVLFIGNSITNAGVDPTLLAREAIKHGVDPNLSVFAAYPDSSHALIWSYLVNRYFIEPGCLPEEVVIVTGRLHLLDAPANHAHLGAFYVSSADTPFYLWHDAGSVDNAVEFLLGKTLTMMSLRSRVSPRLFSLLMPYYQENWLILNQAAMTGVLSKRTRTTADSAETTIHFTKLANQLKRNGVRLTVVAAPMPHSYVVHKNVADALAQADIKFLELNPIPGLTADHFADIDHLNAKGKELFTRALAIALSNHWRK